MVWGFFTKEGLLVDLVRVLSMRSHGQQNGEISSQAEAFLGFGMLGNGIPIPKLHREDVQMHQTSLKLLTMETKRWDYGPLRENAVFPFCNMKYFLPFLPIIVPLMQVESTLVPKPAT